MIRVAMVDDHELIREGFTRLINNQADLELVDSFSGSKTFLEQLNQLEIDVLVLDISLPGKNGLEVLKEIKERKPELSVLILSMHSEEQYAMRTLQNGASGFISKGSDSRIILDAIRKISKGGIYVSASLGEKMAKIIKTPMSIKPHEGLSEREFQILCLIGGGLSTGEIADRIFISENTVRTYRSRIMKKMNLHSTAELIQYAIVNGLSE